MRLIIVAPFILFYISNNAMNHGVIIGHIEKGYQTEIPWKGCEKPLMLIAHIKESAQNRNHPFSVNVIGKYDKETNGFEELANFHTYKFSSEDTKQIEEGNWIFSTNYDTRKTHISPHWYNIGALILGTRDPEMAQKIFLARSEYELKKLFDQ